LTGRDQLEDPRDELVASGQRDVRVVVEVHLRVIGGRAVLFRARLHLIPAAGLEEVPHVHDRTRRAAVAGDAADRVIELVRQLHLPNAERVDLVEPGVDLLLCAFGRVEEDSAVEDARHLDARDHGELPGVDHGARLERIADDAEPPLAGPAALRVDVVLKLVQAFRFQSNAVHLVARVLLQRIDGAKRVVVDEQVGHDPQPAAPRTLEPAVVVLLVRQRVVPRPVAERRPTVGRVRVDLFAKDHLERGPVAAGLVVGTVDERVGYAVTIPGFAAPHAAADELERHHVVVRVEEPTHLAVRRLALRDRPVDVDIDLGPRRTPAGKREPERHRRVGNGRFGQIERSVLGDGEEPIQLGQGDRETVGRDLPDLPVGELAGISCSNDG
jgi:hypothetical protein